MVLSFWANTCFYLSFWTFYAFGKNKKFAFFDILRRESTKMNDLFFFTVFTECTLKIGDFNDFLWIPEKSLLNFRIDCISPFWLDTFYLFSSLFSSALFSPRSLISRLFSDLFMKGFDWTANPFTLAFTISFAYLFSIGGDGLCNWDLSCSIFLLLFSSGLWFLLDGE